MSNHDPLNLFVAASTISSARDSMNRIKESMMSSKTFQKKMIKKRKKRAHKANLKADRKRIARNREVLYPKTP